MTGKYFNREKTPPICPHKNPVKETCPLLINHLNITEEILWPNTTHSSSKEK
jgi:hypothetical protein